MEPGKAERVNDRALKLGPCAKSGKMIEQTSMEKRRKGDPSLDEARLRQQAIGVKLRQMFDEVVNEPVPDEFLAILRQADDKKPGNG